MMKKLAPAILVMSSALLMSGSVLALDGKQLYQSKGCAACHGPTGDEPIAPMYPKLRGQNEQYAFNQMKDIKSGARDNGQTAVMKPIVTNVTDEELKAIAEWLAQSE